MKLPTLPEANDWGCDSDWYSKEQMLAIQEETIVAMLTELHEVAQAYGKTGNVIKTHLQHNVLAALRGEK